MTALENGLERVWCSMLNPGGPGGPVPETLSTVSVWSFSNGWVGRHMCLIRVESCEIVLVGMKMRRAHSHGAEYRRVAHPPVDYKCWAYKVPADRSRRFSGFSFLVYSPHDPAAGVGNSAVER